MSFKNPLSGFCFAYSKIGDSNEKVHPREMKLANQFKSPKRKAEFLAGRACVQKALNGLEVFKMPVLRQKDRSPHWPFSIIGSISHGAGYAAAISGRAGNGYFGVGLDLEDISREIKTNITRHVLTPSEIERWTAGKGEVCDEVKIIFSIKEAIYKCFYPKGKIQLGFQDAEIEELTSDSFSGRLTKSPVQQDVLLPIQFSGSIQFYQEVILSALCIKTADVFRQI